MIFNMSLNPLKLFSTISTYSKYSFLIDTCSIHQDCIPAVECPYTRNLLLLVQEAKDAGNKDEKTKLISDIQLRICGNKKDRTVCCDLDDQEDIPETLPKR